MGLIFGELGISSSTTDGGHKWKESTALFFCFFAIIWPLVPPLSLSLGVRRSFSFTARGIIIRMTDMKRDDIRIFENLRLIPRNLRLVGKSGGDKFFLPLQPYPDSPLGDAGGSSSSAFVISYYARGTPRNHRLGNHAGKDFGGHVFLEDLIYIHLYIGFIPSHSHFTDW